MEVVKAFNNELSAMYECKPPISKAKMSQVTKAAIRGIKFYKHIVQSVEKFIQKCRPEYKVPGLYVIDSIVRQSRHQFGIDKDVFVPRFSKNMHITFQHLLRCPENDKPRVLKVLNLWLKNGVFGSETIQPLLEKTNPDETTGTVIQEASSPTPPKLKEDPFWDSWQTAGHHSEKIAPSSGPVPQQETKRKSDQTPMLDSAIISQLQELSNQLLNSDSKPKEEAVKFNKKLLDFDYGDEEEEEEEKEENGHASVEPTALALSMAQNLLSNPELLRQLQQMQQTIQQTEALTKSETETQDESMQASNSQGDQYYNQIVPPESPMPQQQATVFCASPPTYVAPQQQLPPLHEVHLPPPINMEPPIMCADMDYGMIQEPHPLVPVADGHASLLYHDHDERQAWAHLKDEDEREMHVRKEEVSRSRSRSPRSSNRSARKHTRRSRSRSPPQRRGNRRSRSRSPSRYNRSRGDKRSGNGPNHERELEREREREKERDRRRKGLPPLKKNFLAVCTTTLWLGHVPKVIAEADINEVFAEFGTIASIDVIPPRGCAYVCMKQRQDASRALQKLRNLKLQGSNVKMAWAPGKGVKGKEYKDFWDVEQGTTFIPYEKVPENVNLEALEEGGMIDEDSMPSNLKEIRQKKEQEKRAKEEATLKEQQQKTTTALPTGTTTTVMPLVPPMASQFGMTAVSGMVGTSPIVMPQMTLALGVPPPNTMMMMPPHTTQQLLNTQSLMNPLVTSIQGPLPTSLPGPIPTSMPSVIATSLSGVMTTSLLGSIQTSLAQLQRPPLIENKGEDKGDKTPTEDEMTKSDKSNAKPAANSIDLTKQVPQFVTPAMQSAFPPGGGMAFPPPGFQPFNSRLPMAPHMQPAQGMVGMPQWGSPAFPRPIGAPPFGPGHLGVIPGMPPQLHGQPPLFPSALHRPSLPPQDFSNSQGPLLAQNNKPQVESVSAVNSESKNEPGVPPAGERVSRFGPEISVVGLSRLNPEPGMGLPRRGVVGGANAIPLPQDMAFRSPRPVNFPPQHGGRGFGGAFGMRPPGPFMMRGGMRGPRPGGMEFRGPPDSNFGEAPFEPEWGRPRQFGPPDRGRNDAYFGREEFDEWEEPDGRDRAYRHEEDDRRFRGSRFDDRFDDRRRGGGGGYRDRERGRFDDYRGGERNGSREWERRDRDRDKERDKDRSRSRSKGESRDERDSKHGRQDRRSPEREAEKEDNMNIDVNSISLPETTVEPVAEPTVNVEPKVRVEPEIVESVELVSAEPVPEPEVVVEPAENSSS